MWSIFENIYCRASIFNNRYCCVSIFVPAYLFLTPAYLLLKIDTVDRIYFRACVSIFAFRVSIVAVRIYFSRIEPLRIYLFGINSDTSWSPYLFLGSRIYFWTRVSIFASYVSIFGPAYLFFWAAYLFLGPAYLFLHPRIYFCLPCIYFWSSIYFSVSIFAFRIYF